MNLRQSLKLVPALFLSNVAQADGGNVVIYGKLDASLEMVKRSGATSAGTPGPVGLGLGPANPAFGQGPGVISGANVGRSNRVTSNLSYIGFKGEENLGDGWAAVWQIESNTVIDGTGGAVSYLGSRNTGVGLRAPIGTVMLGQWDTPYRWSTGRLSPFGVAGVGSYASMFGVPSNVYSINSYRGPLGQSGAPADASFDRRAGDSIQYWSPQWKGFSLRLGYSPNEVDGQSNASPPAKADPRLLSGYIAYQNGPLFVTYAVEHHRDYFATRQLGAVAPTAATDTSSSDYGHKIGIGYTLGDTTLGFAAERLKFESSGGSGANELKSYRRDVFGLFASHRITPTGTVRATLMHASDPSCSLYGRGKACSGDGFGATQYIVGYDHKLTNRTSLYALYSHIDNEKFAGYTFPNNGVVPNSAVGSDPQALSIGVRHFF